MLSVLNTIQKKKKKKAVVLQFIQSIHGGRCAQGLTDRNTTFLRASLVCRAWGWELEASENKEPNDQRPRGLYEWKTLSKKSDRTHYTSIFTSPRSNWDQTLCSTLLQDLENFAWFHVFLTFPLTTRSWEPELSPMYMKPFWKGSRTRKDIWETKQV